jgi:hypothetical protein
MHSVLHFDQTNLHGKDQLGDLGLDGRMLLKWITRHIECQNVDFICLADDKY